MANRRLTDDERELANQLLVEFRRKLNELSSNDASLEWAMRRYIYIRLEHDERGKPTERKLLKAKLTMRQHGKCACCSRDLPQKGTVLDRLEAMKGYTEENTRLLCPSCNVAIQEQRHYA